MIEGSLPRPARHFFSSKRGRCIEPDGREEPAPPFNVPDLVRLRASRVPASRRARLAAPLRT
jgi:hypothetical protein